MKAFAVSVNEKLKDMGSNLALAKTIASDILCWAISLLFVIPTKIFILINYLCILVQK